MGNVSLFTAEALHSDCIMY